MTARKSSKATTTAKPGFPRDQRKRPLVSFTLSPESVAAVDLLSERLGLSKSGTVELALRQLGLREGLGVGELRKAAKALERKRERKRRQEGQKARGSR